MRRAFCLMFLAALAGCGKGSSSGPKSEPAKPTEHQAEAPANGKPSIPAGYERLHQSFTQATRKDPPPGQRPPDLTMTGKSTPKLYTEVVRLWDTIKFMKPDGTRIHYSAVVETDRGKIEIALDPEHAPNHVRSFVALARAGYYDGLVFDTIRQEELENGGRYEEVEAGCPLGTGDPNANSIGYWLEPETGSGATHEEGTVGACHGFEKNTAACKFYVTLCKAPYLDEHYTIFGKVTAGLSIPRELFRQPVVFEESDPEGIARPVNPVVIRKVTIQTHQ